MRDPTGAKSASDAGGEALKASKAVKTFLIRVAISLLRDLLYTRAFSAVRSLLREFCLASTVNAAAGITRVRCGRAANGQMGFRNL